jgi:hypothetical protein
LSYYVILSEFLIHFVVIIVVLPEGPLLQLAILEELTFLRINLTWAFAIDPPLYLFVLLASVAGGGYVGDRASLRSHCFHALPSSIDLLLWREELRLFVAGLSRCEDNRARLIVIFL